MTKPELFAELFRQLAFISALIGGFAFTFVGVLLVSEHRSRVVSWTSALSMAVSAGLVICALGWSVGASVMLMGAAAPAGADAAELSAALSLMHRRLSLVFIVSILFFFAAMGLSGWVRSRRMGFVSSAIAAVAAAGAAFVLLPFLR